MILLLEEVDGIETGGDKADRERADLMLDEGEGEGAPHFRASVAYEIFAPFDVALKVHG